MLDGQERLDLMEAGRRALRASLCFGKILRGVDSPQDIEYLASLGKSLDDKKHSDFRVYDLVQKTKFSELTTINIPVMLQKAKDPGFVQYAFALRDLFKEAYVIANEELYYRGA